MELWIIYTLISAFLAGTSSFMGKVFAEKNHNSLISTGYSLIFSSIFSLISFLFFIGNFNPLYLIFLLALGNGTFYMVSLSTRTKALKYIDSSIYFPIYKISSGIIVAFIGVFIFGESLSVGEIIGIILGLFIPIILIDKKQNKIKNNNFGIILALIGAISTSICLIMSKILVKNDLNILIYASISFIIGGSLALVLGKEKYKNAFRISGNKIKRYSIINGLFIFLSLYFFTKGIAGNLAIAYTINSFSILIPIILSVIFYKEKLDFRKILVIITSIISTILFKLF